MAMAIREVYPNPTVKKVIFQIRFPNLFSMERLIGDYQVKIMAEFPKSALLVRRSVLIGDVGSRAQIENIAADADKLAVRASNIMTVWRKAAASCHSRAGGNPLAPRLSWTPAPDQVGGRLCAGVTRGAARSFC
jgi:hypothetical protein